MRAKSRVFYQVSLYFLLAATAGFMVCILFIWAVDGLWHPKPPGRIDYSMVTGLKVQTVFMLYFPLGILLGGVITILEPIRDTGFKETLAYEWKWLLVGCLFGGLGALIGGGLGEWVMAEVQKFPGGAISALGRALGTMIFGFVLGTSLGVVDRLRSKSNDRLLTGIIGGGVGGVVAALVFHFLIRNVELMSILALFLFAGIIAAAIGSVGYLKTQAFLAGVSGNIFKYQPPFEKALFADSRNIIGSGIPTRISPRATFKVSMDRNVESEHATLELSKETRNWLLSRTTPQAVDIFVNRRRLMDKPAILKDGDLVTFGGTNFRFVLKR